MSVLQLEKISKNFGAIQALIDVSFGIKEGMRLTIEFLERILINETVNYEWSKEKINQLLELWKKGISEEEISKLDK